MQLIRVLISDDVTESRIVLLRELSNIHDIKVVDCVGTEEETLRRAAELEPDVLVLSTELVNHQTLQLLNCSGCEANSLGIIVLSRGSIASKERARECLKMGAFDVVERPLMTGQRTDGSVLVRRLLPKLRSFSASRLSRLAKNMASKPYPTLPLPPVTTVPPATNPQSDSSPPTSSALVQVRNSHQTPSVELVVIGASTGGPEALTKLVRELPVTLGVPVVVVLHVPALFLKSLATQLNRKSKLEVRECQDGRPLRSGTVYLAPGDWHVQISRGPNKLLISRLRDGPPENGCKPSVDVLFRSAARTCGDAVLCVMLTGMGSDGAKGAKVLHDVGARVIVQDEESSVVWGMPGSAVRLGAVDHVLPLKRIARAIARVAGGRWDGNQRA